MKKTAPKNGIYGVTFVARHNARNKIGVTEASYKLEPGAQAIKAAYLFGLKQNGWTLERELNAKEKVNVDSGKIEKR